MKDFVKWLWYVIAVFLFVGADIWYYAPAFLLAIYLGFHSRK